MSRAPKPTGLKPRKTAVQTRATKTVEAIVEAAARILETLGFEGYTTNAIAERAGVSIGSLYQYFPNKDAITLALIAREAALLLHELHEVRAAERWQEALDRMVAAAVRHQLRRPVLARLLDVEEARLPITGDAKVTSDKIYNLVRVVIEQASGTAGSVLDQLAADVIGMTRGMTDMAGQQRETDEQGLAVRVHRAVFAYLGAS